MARNFSIFSENQIYCKDSVNQDSSKNVIILLLNCVISEFRKVNYKLKYFPIMKIKVAGLKKPTKEKYSLIS